MSGADRLAFAMQAVSEMGIDDPRVHQAFQDAIDSGDLVGDDLAFAHLELGRCWHGTGEQAKAETQLAQAISIGNSPGLLGLAHHELGETHFAMGQEAKAEEHLRKSLEHDRQHPFSPDTLLLLGRVAYVRTEQTNDLALTEECYGFFDEALAMLQAPGGDNYGTFFGREKALFDAYFGKAICKSDMPSNTERLDGARCFEQAEQIALAHPEAITLQELENVYKCWIAMLQRMGLERDAQLVTDRASRNLR